MNPKYYKALVLALIVTAIAAVIVFAVRLTSKNNASPTQEMSSVSVTESTEAAGSAASGATTVPLAAALESHFHEEATAPAMELPGASGETSVFSAVYKPDTRAEDVQTGAAVHLREVFGTGYANAAFTFLNDGTFTDTLSGKAGSYQVENGAITAIALPDQRLEITVMEWKTDGKTPQRFSVIYRTVGEKGYKVIYAEK